MNKIKVFIIEGDEIQIKIVENYLNDNKDIDIKYIKVDTYNNDVMSYLLHNLGLPSHIKGYNYITKAIELLISKEDNNMSRIYKKVAEIYDTKVSNVESSIRYAIDISWNRGNIELINKIFGYSIDISRVKPTNTEYLTTLTEIIINKGHRIDN